MAAVTVRARERRTAMGSGDKRRVADDEQAETLQPVGRLEKKPTTVEMPNRWLCCVNEGPCSRLSHRIYVHFVSSSLRRLPVDIGLRVISSSRAETTRRRRYAWPPPLSNEYSRNHENHPSCSRINRP
jgi:hypothetical protein